MSDFDEGLTDKASAKSWIFALTICLLMLGGFSWIKYGPPEFFDTQSVEVADDEKPTAKTKKKKRKKRKKRTNKATGEVSWENSDDYDDPGIELGDVMDDEETFVETTTRTPEPPYVPTKAEYQPHGSYAPTANYKESGASTSNATTLDMSTKGEASGLRDDQIRGVLSIGKLMACYETLASKIPEMKGNVSLKIIVEPDGHVSWVEFKKSELRSRVVEKCLVNRIKKLRFPRAQKPTKFTQSYSFK